MAKLILFGEHVVLYGQPAVSMRLPQLPVRATARRGAGGAPPEPLVAGDADPQSRLGVSAVARVARTVACRHLEVDEHGLRIGVDSRIPAGRGLGASAAVAAAVIGAVADLHDRSLDRETSYTLVQRAEMFAHGRASGVDARTVTGDGGPMWFHAGAFRALPMGPAQYRPRLVVADTGVFGSTRTAVAAVADRLAALGEGGDELVRRAGAITTSAIADLAAGQYKEIGPKMTANQQILADLGVSCPEIDHLVEAATCAGAWGAKLSGGGLGGCVVALTADEPAAAAVTEALTAAGARSCVTVGLNPEWRS